MKSVYRRAAESLVNKTLPFSHDHSCFHVSEHCACERTAEYCGHVIKYRTFFKPTTNDLRKLGFWGKTFKSPEELLAASLALLFMEYLDV